MNGMLREVRLLTLQALSGTSGTPGVSSSLVAAARQLEWRMQAGLQVARPSKDGRSGVQITLRLCGAGWRSQSPSCHPCRQPIEQGECLREYIGIWRFESARRSIDRSASRIDLSPAGGRKRMANAGRTTGIERPQRKSRKVGCSNHPFRPRMESSSVIVLPTLVARPNEQDECLRDYR